MYIGFHDPHRCGHTHPEFGNFCEKFGNGQEGMGSIVDWSPTIYHASDVNLPYYMPNTEETKSDLAAYCTTISRLDQGKLRSFSNFTLIRKKNFSFNSIMKLHY